MSRSRTDFLIAALTLSIGVQWLIAFRLRLAVNALGSPFSTAQLFGINAATRFYGLFLPGGNVTGIAIRFYKVAREHRTYAETAVSLYAERVIATVSLCGVGLLFWLIERPVDHLWTGPFIGIALLGSLYLLAVLLGRAPLPFVRYVDRGLSRFGGSTLDRLRVAVERTRELPRRLLLTILVLSIAIHLLGIFTFLLIAQSLGWDASYLTMGWIRSVLILVTMIPISVSGLGLRESGALLLLGAYGNDEAVAFSLLVFAVTVMFFGLIGGVVEARRLAFNRAD
jgi:uncharacterized membrane protein YbhN (UPF0104 family)